MTTQARDIQTVTAEAFLAAIAVNPTATFEDAKAIERRMETQEEVLEAYGKLPAQAQKDLPDYADYETVSELATDVSCYVSNVITDATIERETAKAMLVDGDFYVGRGNAKRGGRVTTVSKAFWVPKSQATVVELDGETFVFLTPWFSSKLKSQTYTDTKAAWRSR